MWKRAWAAYVLDALKGAIAAARSPSPATTVLLRRVKSCLDFMYSYIYLTAGGLQSAAGDGLWGH